jgi:acyl carrier protein
MWEIIQLIPRSDEGFVVSRIFFILEDFKVSNKFCNELADVFEISTEMIQEEAIFESKAPWDSLRILSTISLVDEFYSVALSTSEIMKCKDLAALMKVVQSRGASV